ncbi:MAG: hypothetical protein ACRECR_00405, partial [Thermoplasmata archaeon]
MQRNLYRPGLRATVLVGVALLLVLTLPPTPFAPAAGAGQLASTGHAGSTGSGVAAPLSSG